jgi:type II secretory pathway component PulF
LLSHFIWNSFESLTGSPVSPPIASGLWLAPVCIGVVLAAGLIAVSLSPARRKLRWRLPAFKEASLAQVASAMTLMLKNGVPLNDALGFAEQMEQGTPAEKELGQWRQRLGSGLGKFSEMAASPTVFPPLFVWTVTQSGENLTAGFERTSEIYQARAGYRVEMFLYSLLPCAILALGAMLLSQIQPVVATLLSFIRNLGGDMG